MSSVATHEFEMPVPGLDAGVAAVLETPADAVAAYVFAHGAGAGMRHAFIAETAAMLHGEHIATLRYQFPYMQAGGHRPDPPARLERTVRAAIATAGTMLPGVPLFAGGKSMGGRMTSQAAASEPLSGVRGLAFLGFPLHPPKRPGTTRARHLADVTVPMLFIQGTRDDLADLDLIQGVCTGLGGRATLHVVDGGDHSFKVLKRSGRTQPDVMNEIRDTMSAWLRQHAS
ncbi:MAG TPA: alpha/beta family hydrolase [Candidatus Krumholzibacteria bacterium]|nr:alpha/beta family hydrolase [Candidatus Krumholzibacteria bacterium]